MAVFSHTPLVKSPHLNHLLYYFLTNNLNYLHYPEKDVPVVTASPLHRTSHGVTASSAKAELTMLADLLGESVSV